MILSTTILGESRALEVKCMMEKWWEGNAMYLDDPKYEQRALGSG